MNRKFYEVTDPKGIKYIDGGNRTLEKKKGDIISFDNPRLPDYLKDKIKAVVLEPEDVVEAVKRNPLFAKTMKANEELTAEVEVLQKAAAERTALVYKMLDDESLLKLDKGFHLGSAAELNVKCNKEKDKEADLIKKIKKSLDNA